MTLDEQIAESSGYVAAERLRALRQRVDLIIAQWNHEMDQQCDFTKLPPQFAHRHLRAALGPETAEKAKLLFVVDRNILAALLATHMTKEIITQAWRTLLKPAPE